MEVPSTPKRKQLSRDQRLQVHTLTSIHWTPHRIAKHLDITPRQAKYACSVPLTPQKQRCGRKSILNTPSHGALVRYIRTSKEDRRMPYHELAVRMGWNVSESVIQSALRKEGAYFWGTSGGTSPVGSGTRWLDKRTVELNTLDGWNVGKGWQTYTYVGY